MEEKIILGDGTVFDQTTVLEMNGRLHIYCRGGQSMRDVFDALYENERLSPVTVKRYGEEREITGYTWLADVCREDDGQISASLRRG